MSDENADLINKFQEKLTKITSMHAAYIEKKLQQVMVESDCKPSDLTIYVEQKNKYTIMVKKDEFSFDYNFYTSGEGE